VLRHQHLPDELADRVYYLLTDHGNERTVSERLENLRSPLVEERTRDNVDMAGTVWVSEWQLRCCGDQFDVGAWVQWHVRPPDTAWLTDLLGVELAATVVGMEEHHDRLEDATELSGRVRSIHAVTREPDHQVTGSAVLTEVATSDDDGPVAGYLVELVP
jgi:hypothetical protein